MEDKRLFLIDAFAMIFRAYYALLRTPRITSYGKNTNAQFGFTNSLIDIIKKEKPTHIAVCFDSPGETERHSTFIEYKANRQEAPEDLLSAIPDIKEIIKAWHIPIVEMSGYEADDIIGTLAKQAEKLGYTTYMVTPDKDFGQLVSENTKMYIPAKGGKGPEIMGPEEVCAKWGIKRIDQVIDMLGLMGDAADNIPGIKGVGEKTAAKLLSQFDTLENILDNAEKLTGSLGTKVQTGRKEAIMSKMLATIILDVPIEFHEENFKLESYDKVAMDAVFQKLEFRTLGKRLLGEDFQVNDQLESKIVLNQSPTQGNLFSEILEANSISKFDASLVNYHLLEEPEEIKSVLNEISKSNLIAFDTETTGLDTMLDYPIGLSLCTVKGTAYYINLLHPNKPTIIDLLQKFFSQDKIWIGHNVKFDMGMLENYNIKIDGKIFDTLLAHYILDAGSKHNMNDLAIKYLYYEPISIETLIGSKGKNQLKMNELAAVDIYQYACEDADITFQLFNIFSKKLIEENAINISEDFEFPLVRVLNQLEKSGFNLDIDFLKEYSIVLGHEIEIFENKVFDLAGEKFNLASPKQLGDILYEKMQLVEKPKKTKTGQYSTKEEDLLKLQGKHPIIDSILEFRELSKLKSTYVDSLPNLLNPNTKKIHTTFNQALAVTGRLSSVNPNLQNIPIKSERGRKVRQAFIPSSSDHVILSADYSQIELRIIAYISGDATMINAFKEGKDIHTATASKVFRVAEDEVTKEMRYKAKAVNFGIIYGQSAFGLAENLGISRIEGKAIIDNYFQEFPSIRTYMNEIVQSAKRDGYVKTIIGRKRWLPDIHSANAVVRGFAERNAINSPIQGSAADLIKKAMIHVQNAISSFGSRMILQVHDELVFDVLKSELENISPVIKYNMENAMNIGDVPLVVELGYGKNWLEAH